MNTTPLSLNDVLPLTCTRQGVCCHGNVVHLNPWEVACLAQGRGILPQEFLERYVHPGGTQLRFDGAPGWENRRACNLYEPSKGCPVHSARPLACRLYPLGRERQGDEVRYMHRGQAFPCLKGCPDVQKLPAMSVGVYLEGQQTQDFETAQDGYLELMQDLAEWGFALILETGLPRNAVLRTTHQWRRLGEATSDQRVGQIPSDWATLLLTPSIPLQLGHPEEFIRIHASLLQTKANQSFATESDPDRLCTASTLMMALALQLADGLGANPASLATRWEQTVTGAVITE
ncbi:MAG TPA: YkgJ family cysteine cluster protein [Fibrobacteraceae bacterium]|nr:YkgJ family cysteine cluster protein [Fibrobacteraceae bacterium]